MTRARSLYSNFLRGAGAWMVVSALPMGALDAQEVTFTRDVAPILYENCVMCHRPGSFAPMSLIDYETARRYASRIRAKVETRQMPPWHVDRTIGIQDFENDPSLADQEIETIVRWVDGGALKGNDDDMPPPPVLAEGGAWQLEETYGRPPDVVVSSATYDVVANGQDQWWGPLQKFEGADVDRWIKGYEFKPAYPNGLRVVHHGHATLEYPDRDGDYAGGVGIAHYGVGKRYETFPEGVGMLLPAGDAEVSWNIHYFPVGDVVEDDVIDVGLWLYPPGERPEIETRGEVPLMVDRRNGMPRAGDILIPPHGRQVLQGVHVMESPVLISSFRPHMHMRGKEMSMEAIYPDGRREVLGKVSDYRHIWQISYQFEEDAKPLLPAGTMLLFTSVFDNTADNPLNPDPNQWVVFGRRGVDEMSHMWVGITDLEQEEYDTILERRQERQRQTAAGSG
jgi:hypothetical protein